MEGMRKERKDRQRVKKERLRKKRQIDNRN
jgi:hypothetical protein